MKETNLDSVKPCKHRYFNKFNNKFYCHYKQEYCTDQTSYGFNLKYPCTYWRENIMKTEEIKDKDWVTISNETQHEYRITIALSTYSLETVLGNLEDYCDITKIEMSK